jgi:hypothetical protein
LSAPRIDTSTGHLLADARLDDDLVHGLRSLGHDVESVHPDHLSFNFARPNAILRTAGGDMRAGGDPYAPQFPLMVEPSPVRPADATGSAASGRPHRR